MTIKKIVGTAILLQLLLAVNTQMSPNPRSPCPNYFNYMRDEDTGEILGQVQINNPAKETALHIKVTLSVAVALPTKYVGRLELAQSKEESVAAVNQGRPLIYRIRFPVRWPIPVFTGLWFNGQQRCAGPKAMGMLVTSIFLEHTLYPAGTMPLSENQSNQNIRPINPSENLHPMHNPNNPYWSDNFDMQYQPMPQFPPQPVFTERPEPMTMPQTVTTPITMKTRPTTMITRPTTITTRPASIITSRPRPKPEALPQPDSTPINIIPFNPQTDLPTTTSNDNIFFKEECGKSYVTGVNPLIAKGDKTHPGQWPWLAAMFIVKINFEFQCAGNLLTKSHLITAAHCLKLANGIDVPASAMLISLGRYRLRDWREKGSVNREVRTYYFHPDYKHRGSADSDLAIIVLRESVEFSRMIQPLCLWNGSPDLQPVVGKSGYVVGWGRDEFGNPYLSEPRMSTIPIVSQEDCLWSNTDFVAFTSNRTFCAGMRDGSGPCNGDSGSGLVIKQPSTGRFHLRGIVSRSLLDKDTMSCDLSQYVVYSDAAKHMDWIVEQLAR
ncbi:serine protease gd-like [Prorops nasuta]|uniref:serine protease gd-like n=1 Tax=Prorops nasuta TaxID=863751 RepID=UPI0034CFA04F